MIKRLILIFVISTTAVVGFSQKYAFVDTKYVLENLPDFKEAQRLLDEFSEKWQNELEEKQKEIAKKQQALEAEKVILPPEQLKANEEEIERLIQELREEQKKKFGVGGELFLKRQELIEPIQDRIYNAIKDVAEKGNYAFVFDSSASSSNILFADKKYDKSDLVLRNLNK